MGDGSAGTSSVVAGTHPQPMAGQWPQRGRRTVSSRAPVTRAQRIEEIEWQVRDAGEARKVAGSPSTHVVLLAVIGERLELGIPAERGHPLWPVPALAPGLKDANDADDLQLGGSWDGVPHGRRAHASEGRVVAPGVQRERPVDAVLVHNVANEPGHCDAAMLHLGVAQKSWRAARIS